MGGLEIIGVIIAGIIIGLLGKFVAPGDKDNIPLWLDRSSAGSAASLIGWFIYTRLRWRRQPAASTGSAGSIAIAVAAVLVMIASTATGRSRSRRVAVKAPSARWVRPLWGGWADPSPPLE